MRSTQKVPGASARCQASFPIALTLFTKTHLPVQKSSQKHKKPNFRGQAIHEPIFEGGDDAEFEGGDHGRGCFD
jgi:hypothetical protein